MGNGVEKKKKAKGEGSLKAGFILVGIGLVFLLSNLANIPISKTWPLFLIIVGSSLLIGALKDRNTPEPMPPYPPSEPPPAAPIT